MKVHVPSLCGLALVMLALPSTRVPLWRATAMTLDNTPESPVWQSPAEYSVATEASSENVEFVSHIGGQTIAVSVQGTYAYVGEGPQLTILDVSDPDGPSVLGKTALLPGIVQAIHVRSTYAYVVAPLFGLGVVDISDPTAPVEVGICNTPGEPQDIAVAGDYAYVVGGSTGGLRVIDVSNPTAPVEVGFCDTPGSAHDVALDRDYAYVADGTGGLRVVDVSTPTHPVEVGIFSSTDSAISIVVMGNYAYAVFTSGALRVVDISDPAAPTLVGIYWGLGRAESLAVIGGYAYVAAYEDGMRVVDISDPAHPAAVSSYNTPGFAYGVAVGEDYAYVADLDSLQIVNIGNPVQPTSASLYNTRFWANDAAVAGNYAYIATRRKGLQVVGVSNPAAPIEISSSNTPEWAEAVALAGSYLYVAAGTDGLRVINASDPEGPIEIGSYSASVDAQDVVVAGDYAYVASDRYGLQVMNVGDPAHPSLVGAYDTPSIASGVAIAGGHAYVADGYPGGLRVIDVSNSTAPVEVGFCGTLGMAIDVAVDGDYAYIADSYFGLWVVDISDPTAPTEVGSCGMQGSPHGVAVDGNYAYVAAVSGGLRVVDITNPAAPFEVGFYDTAMEAQNVVVDAGYAYVSQGIYGFTVLQYLEPVTRLVYVGPPDVRGENQFFQGEVDRRISLGDHVHLQLPFHNTGSKIITDATVEVTGPPAFPSVGVRVYDGADWDTTQQIQLTPSTLYPGQAGLADFWIYVTNPDPDSLLAQPTGTRIRVSTGYKEWDLPILLEPVVLEATGHWDLLSGSCLHHPNDAGIRRYAQYAVGTIDELTPPGNSRDPDSAEQAVTNLLGRVTTEYQYVDTDEWREEDTVLLARRGSQGIGECRHFADFGVGLLRSLGLPARFTGAQFVEGAHGWVEVYMAGACTNGWSPVDPTWAHHQWYAPLFPDIYEQTLGRFLWGSADLLPLSNAASLRRVPYLCTPACYDQANCAACRFGYWSLDSSCVESIEPCYHTDSTIAATSAHVAEEGISVELTAPVFVTRTVPFAAHVSITNSSPSAIDVVTVTIPTFREDLSTTPTYETKIGEQVVTALPSGDAVSLTWVVAPLVSGTNVPLEAVAYGENLAAGDAVVQVVKDPGSLPPLSLVGTCGLGSVDVGATITLTAIVLDETREAISDSSAVVYATVVSTPSLGFSQTISIPYCGTCETYRQTLHVPYAAPVGRYVVEYWAARTGYDSARASSAFWVAPQLTMTLTLTPSTLAPTQRLSLTAQVFDRGDALAEAGVEAEIITPGGTVTIPLFGDGGEVYTATLRPADLSYSLDVVSPGDWTVKATGNYQGGVATATQSITVLQSIYLPLVLRR